MQIVGSKTCHNVGEPDKCHVLVMTFVSAVSFLSVIGQRRRSRRNISRKATTFHGCRSQRENYCMRAGVRLDFTSTQPLAQVMVA